MKPKVAVGGLGGTIAMTPAAPGEAVSPSLTAADLVASVPGMSDVAEITSDSICNVASPALTVANILDTLEFAKKAVAEGAAGVALTHGTDTLEETTYLLDLLWDRPEPIVVTGAMRNPALAGAEGPGNLLAAVVTAASPDSRGLGVLAALDDTIHLARLVRKTHTTALHTFQSPGWGPVGTVIEKETRYMFRPQRMFDPLSVPAAGDVHIPVIQIGHSEDMLWLRPLVDSGVRGLVLAAAGAGHITDRDIDELQSVVDAGIPVILSSRTGNGTTLRSTYGYPGSEQDLLARGLIGSGYLAPSKARMLLHVLLSAGYDMEAIRKEFAIRGQ